MAVRDLLKYELLMELYQRDGSSFPSPISSMYNVNPRDVDSDEARLMTNGAESRPAPLNHRGAPARVLDSLGKTSRRGAIFHAFNEIPFSSDLMIGLREPDSELIDDRSAREIQDRLSGFGLRHVIQKEVVFAKALTDGKVYTDNEGQILEATAANAFEADFDLIDAHYGNLSSITGSALNVADDGEDIEAWLTAVDDYLAGHNLPPISDITCHITMRAQLMANTLFNAAFKESGAESSPDLFTRTITGVFGRTWRFVGHTYAKTSGGVGTVMPKKKMLMSCPTSIGWIQGLRGVEFVPTDIYRSESAMDLLSSMRKTYGQFAYAKLNDNPIQLEAFLGDHYGLIVKDPYAVFCATVDQT